MTPTRHNCSQSNFCVKSVHSEFNLHTSKRIPRRIKFICKENCDDCTPLPEAAQPSTIQSNPSLPVPSTTYQLDLQPHEFHATYIRPFISISHVPMSSDDRTNIFTKNVILGSNKSTSSEDTELLLNNKKMLLCQTRDVNETDAMQLEIDSKIISCETLNGEINIAQTSQCAKEIKIKKSPVICEQNFTNDIVLNESQDNIDDDEVCRILQQNKKSDTMCNDIQEENTDDSLCLHDQTTLLLDLYLGEDLQIDHSQHKTEDIDAEAEKENRGIEVELEKHVTKNEESRSPDITLETHFRLIIEDDTLDYSTIKDLTRSTIATEEYMHDICAGYHEGKHNNQLEKTCSLNAIEELISSSEQQIIKSPSKNDLQYIFQNTDPREFTEVKICFDDSNISLSNNEFEHGNIIQQNKTQPIANTFVQDKNVTFPNLYNEKIPLENKLKLSDIAGSPMSQTKLVQKLSQKPDSGNQIKLEGHHNLYDEDYENRKTPPIEEFISKVDHKSLATDKPITETANLITYAKTAEKYIANDLVTYSIDEINAKIKQHVHENILNRLPKVILDRNQNIELIKKLLKKISPQACHQIEKDKTVSKALTKRRKQPKNIQKIHKKDSTNTSKLNLDQIDNNNNLEKSRNVVNLQKKTKSLDSRKVPKNKTSNKKNKENLLLEDTRNDENESSSIPDRNICKSNKRDKVKNKEIKIDDKSESAISKKYKTNPSIKSKTDIESKLSFPNLLNQSSKTKEKVKSYDNKFSTEDVQITKKSDIVNTQETSGTKSNSLKRTNDCFKNALTEKEDERSTDSKFLCPVPLIRVVKMSTILTTPAKKKQIFINFRIPKRKAIEPIPKEPKVAKTVDEKTSRPKKTPSNYHKRPNKKTVPYPTVESSRKRMKFDNTEQTYLLETPQPLMKVSLPFHRPKGLSLPIPAKLKSYEQMWEHMLGLQARLTKGTEQKQRNSQWAMCPERARLDRARGPRGPYDSTVIGSSHRVPFVENSSGPGRSGALYRSPRSSTQAPPAHPRDPRLPRLLSEEKKYDHEKKNHNLHEKRDTEITHLNFYRERNISNKKPIQYIPEKKSENSNFSKAVEGNTTEKISSNFYQERNTGKFSNTKITNDNRLSNLDCTKINHKNSKHTKNNISGHEKNTIINTQEREDNRKTKRQRKRQRARRRKQELKRQNWQVDSRYTRLVYN